MSSSGVAELLVESHHGVSFEKLRVVHPSGRTSFEVYLHGATVTSWKIMDEELLFLSEKVVFAPGKAIRGGIPIVFPQFGPGALPQHGFARNKTWRVGGTEVHKQSGDITTTLLLSSDPDTLRVWPHRFELQLTLVLKLTSLSMQLAVTNQDEKPFNFTALFHTYFNVSHITKAIVRGLQGISYVDKLQNSAVKTQTNEFITFEGEVDRVYMDAGNRSVYINDGGNCELMLKSTLLNDVVVWNPFIAKTATMGDMHPDAWQRFICVEAGTVNHVIEIQPGQTWKGSQGLSLQMLPDAVQQVQRNQKL